MFASNQRNREGSNARRRLQQDALLAKLLTRVVQECRRIGVDATPEIIDAARSILADRLSTGTIADRELRAIVKQVAGARSQSVAAALHAPADRLPQQTQESTSAPARQPAPDASAGVQRATPTPSTLSGALLLNTTKRERQLLADTEWIKQANEDREQAAVKRVQERTDRRDYQLRQQDALNSQLREHEEEKRRNREARRKAQDDMTEAIRNAQAEARREKDEAMHKAQREREFRERQVTETEKQREQQRLQEHNDQVRHMMMLQQEVQRQRDEEARTKAREQEEWKRVLSENEERLADKARTKERERDLDRKFQREYEENLDRQERERAEALARKEARAATFQQMANVVAQMHATKVQNVDEKIEAEYQEQQRRALEDERARRQRAKQRTQETHEVLRRQQKERDDQKARDREEARQLARAMQEQAEEAARQEKARRAAAKAEAARMKDFLTTQLQLQHFRETRPPETSIARPESRAKSMYSPSRFTPSPAPL